MDDRRLGRLEIVGAWLGLWTPPRDAVVPPVPWRLLGAVAVLLVVAAGIAVALLAPGVRGGREQAAERERAAAAQRHARALATAEREQRPRTGRGPADPGAGAAPARRARARTALLTAAREALQADAATRRAGRIRGLDCEPFPGGSAQRAPVAELSRASAAYQCVAVTSRFSEGSEQEGVIGLPFRLVTRFARGRYAFCRVVPLSDRDRLTHPLPAACRL